MCYTPLVDLRRAYVATANLRLFFFCCHQPALGLSLLFYELFDDFDLIQVFKFHRTSIPHKLVKFKVFSNLLNETNKGVCGTRKQIFNVSC